MTTRRLTRALTPWLFVAPATVLLGVFVIYPVAQLLWVSLHEWNILEDRLTWVGLANYRAVLADDVFWQALWNTLVFVLATVPLGLALSLGLALLLDERLRAVGLFRTVMFAPVVTSAAAAGIVFVWLMDYDQGALNALIAALGLPRVRFLQSETWALPSVIVMTLWKQAGYNMVLFLAGLQGIPQSCYEAAELDGAGTGWRRFRHVTWPLLWPTTFFVLVVSVIFAFRAFEPMYVMTRGGPVGATTTLVYYVFDQAFRFGEMGRAAAVSALMTALVLALTWVQFRVRGDDQA
jgi:multiple sugar transport system permease protein